jgi:glycerol-3-phosphate acyltransferase PlsX
VKIALDAMGGDLAPKAAVEGGVLAARDFGIEVVMVGDRDCINRELAEHDLSGLAITVEHADEIVLMDDSPLESVLGKPHSSIHVGFDLVKSGAAHGFVSAGNSGAMMATAMVILGTLPGVDRPAIGTIVPTAEGQALLIDAGANTEVKPINLVQFAVMGSVYWRRVRNVSRPRVGILSNGEEASKGTDLTRAAAATLGQMGSYVNYIGYVEGRDINRGKADVIVTDGFTGNVALKTMEGFAAFMMGNLRELFSTSWPGRMAYFLVRKRLVAIRERLDPHEYGGAPLLGVGGVAIIAHGSSNARAIRNAVRAAADDSLVSHVNGEIAEILARSQPSMPAKGAPSKGFRALFSRMRDRLHRQPKESDGSKPKESEAAKPLDAAKATDAPRAITQPPVASNHAEPPAQAAPSQEHPKLDDHHESTVAQPASVSGPSAGGNGSKPVDGAAKTSAQPETTAANGDFPRGESH